MASLCLQPSMKKAAGMAPALPSPRAAERGWERPKVECAPPLRAAPAPEFTQPARTAEDSDGAAVNSRAQDAKNAERRHEPDRAERFALPHHRAGSDEQRRCERQPAECELHS